MTANIAPERSMAVSFQQAARQLEVVALLGEGGLGGTASLLLSTALPSVHHGSRDEEPLG